MIDLGFIVDAEAVTVSYISNMGGAYNEDGKWIENPALVTDIVATVQPTSGRILRDLPEGIRDQADFTLWTRSVLALGDAIGYDGRTFRVIHLWPRYEGGFTRAVLGLRKP